MTFSLRSKVIARRKQWYGPLNNPDVMTRGGCLTAQSCMKPRMTGDGEIGCLMRLCGGEEWDGFSSIGDQGSESIKPCQKVGARKSPATVCVEEQEPDVGSHALLLFLSRLHLWHSISQSINLSKDVSS